MSSTNLPSYDNIEVIFHQLTIEQLPAEIHGTVCGYLCTGNFTAARDYIQQFVKKDEPDRDAVDSLYQLVDISQQQINTHSFDFHLLLPDDDDDLSFRAEALSVWCMGFNRSLNECHIEKDDLQDEESRDALLHIEEFANIDFNNLAIDEEDEKAFTELNEYIRMAVLMIHTELNKPVTDGNKTVH